jgi:hypothetical protein
MVQIVMAVTDVLAGLGSVSGGPSGDLPSPDTPDVAGTEEPQTERAVSPENGPLGVPFLWRSPELLRKRGSRASPAWLPC